MSGTISGSHVIDKLAAQAIQFAGKKGIDYLVNAAEAYATGNRKSAKRVSPPMPTSFRKRRRKTGPKRRRGVSSKHRFFTSGIAGGAFKKPRSGKRGRKARTAKPTTFRKRGSELKYEIGGVLGDPDCVYIGHSTNGGEFWLDMFCRNVVRDLFGMKGTYFADWNQQWTDNMTFEVRYKDGVTNSVSTTLSWTSNDSLINFDQTYLGLAYEMKKRIQDAFRADAALGRYHEIPVFDHFKLLNVADVEAWIRATDYYHVFKVESTLVLQNRSLANDDAGADPVRTLVTDISNNPLIGRQYIGTQNGFTPKVRETLGQLPANYQPFHPQYDKPVILSQAQYTLTDTLAKPPPGSFFKNCKKSNRVQLNPGQLKKSYLRTSLKLSCQRFNNLFYHAWIIDATDDYQRLPKGHCAMFGFEKLLNSRVDEPSISIAWELNQMYHSYGYYTKQQSAAPIVIVGENEVRPVPDPPPV